MKRIITKITITLCIYFAACSCSLAQITKDTLPPKELPPQQKTSFVSKDDLPQFGKEYMQDGETKWHHNDFEGDSGAIADFTKVIKLNPTYGKAYFCRAMVYYQKRNYEKAIVDFSKSIELNTKVEDAYRNRASANSYLKNYDIAVADFSKAIELNPSDYSAYEGRGWAYYDLKNFEKACQDWKKANELGDKRVAETITKNCK